MPFLVSFLLGETLAKSVGASNTSDQIASGAALAASGGSLAGIVLARQLAINRASAASTTTTTTTAAGTATAGAPSPDPTQSNTVANKLIDKVAEDEHIEREEARARIVAYLTQLAGAIATSTEPPDQANSAIGRDVLRELTAIADQEAQAQGHDSPAAVIKHDPPDGFDVTFDGAGSKADKGASITSYTWSFSDDTSDTGKSVTHTFPAAGHYHVRLEVTDSWGNSNAKSVGIHIREDPTLK
jgi:hypothetical protein